jgi:hypothetical protein
LVAGPDVGRPQNPPRSHIPEAGKSIEDGGKPGSNPVWVLKNAPSRAQSSHHIEYVVPQPSLISSPFAATGLADGLARRAAADQVHRLDVVPLDLAQVAQVRHLGPMTA